MTVARPRVLRHGSVSGRARIGAVVAHSTEVAIDAYTELVELGEVGAVSHALVARLMSRMVHRFPGLMPPSGWTSDDVEDLTQEFLAQKFKRLAEAALTTVDDEPSLTRYVTTMVRNFLIGEVRKTPLGKVRRKLEDLLRGSSDYAQTADHWHLTAGASSPHGGTTAHLVQLAAGVPVTPVVWNGDRDAPLASDAELNRVLHAVLRAGAVTVGELTVVVAARFTGSVRLADVDLPDAEYGRAVVDPSDRPDISVVYSESAVHVVASLSPVQRRLVPVLDAGLGEQQRASGVGRSQTYELVATTKRTLQNLLDNDDAAIGVLGEVVELCQALVGEPPSPDDAPGFGVSPGAGPDDGVEEVASR